MKNFYSFLLLFSSLFSFGQSKTELLPNGTFPPVEENIKQILPKVDLIIFAMADELWGEKLCLASSSNIDVEELRTKLDPILTPKEIFLFEEIPTTALGKPDRKRAIAIAKGMKTK